MEDGTFVKLRELSASTRSTGAGRSASSARRRRSRCRAATCSCGPTTAATTQRSTSSARTPAGSAPCRRRRPTAASTSAAIPFRACGRSARDSPTDRRRPSPMRMIENDARWQRRTASLRSPRGLQPRSHRIPTRPTEDAGDDERRRRDRARDRAAGAVRARRTATSPTWPAS